jgi:hypothetical protein
MPNQARPAAPPASLGRRGVALPIALLGLVMVSLLVTTALVTSASENSTVAANQDAVKGLYSSEAALQGYVAQQFNDNLLSSNRIVDGASGSVTPAGSSAAYTITISELRDSMNTTSDPVVLLRTYALVASPGNGLGRAVGTILQTKQSQAKITTSVDAGATSGGNINVSGNAQVSDGTGNTNCSLSKASYALQATAGSTITTGGSSQITGGTNVTTYAKEQIVNQLLNGVPLDTMAKYADIRFGPRFSKPDFGSTHINNAAATALSYNWGCPTGMGITCTGPASDSTRVPVIAIDARGGAIGITGDYGQGLLIVVNGDLSITGNFSFKGLILVERDFSIRGTGGDVGKIQGAIVALGTASTQSDQYLGNAVITYNRCSVNAATEALNNNRVVGANQTLSVARQSWFEVVH